VATKSQNSSKILLKKYPTFFDGLADAVAPDVAGGGVSSVELMISNVRKLCAKNDFKNHIIVFHFNSFL